MRWPWFALQKGCNHVLRSINKLSPGSSGRYSTRSIATQPCWKHWPAKSATGTPPTENALVTCLITLTSSSLFRLVGCWSQGVSGSARARVLSVAVSRSDISSRGRSRGQRHGFALPPSRCGALCSLPSLVGVRATTPIIARWPSWRVCARSAHALASSRAWPSPYHPHSSAAVAATRSHCVHRYFAVFSSTTRLMNSQRVLRSGIRLSNARVCSIGSSLWPGKRGRH